MKKQHYQLFAILNAAAFLLMVAINALANILPINNLNTGEIAAMYPNLFVPAGITFSIWGLIYLLLFAFIIYQFVAIGKKKKQAREFIQKISLLFIISSLLNTAWIFAWHYQKIHLSVIIMILLLLCLMLIYRRLDIGTRGISQRERYLVHLPFSIYLGWISIATIANITALLVGVGWTRWGLTEEFWAIVMMLIGSLLAINLAFLKRDIYFGLVTIWALLGIILKQYSILPEFNKLTSSAIVLIGVILFVHVIQILRKKVY